MTCAVGVHAFLLPKGGTPVLWSPVALAVRDPEKVCNMAALRGILIVGPLGRYVSLWLSSCASPRSQSPAALETPFCYRT